MTLYLQVRCDSYLRPSSSHFFLFRKLKETLPITDTEGHPNDQQKGEVHYLQSQNGNLFSSRYFDMSGEEEDPSEFEVLRDYIPSDVPWCSDALGRLVRHLVTVFWS